MLQNKIENPNIVEITLHRESRPIFAALAHNQAADSHVLVVCANDTNRPDLHLELFIQEIELMEASRFYELQDQIDKELYEANYQSPITDEIAATIVAELSYLYKPSDAPNHLYCCDSDNDVRHEEVALYWKYSVANKQ